MWLTLWLIPFPPLSPQPLWVFVDRLQVREPDGTHEYRLKLVEEMYRRGLHEDLMTYSNAMVNKGRGEEIVAVLKTIEDTGFKRYDSNSGRMSCAKPSAAMCAFREELEAKMKAKATPAEHSSSS